MVLGHCLLLILELLLVEDLASSLPLIARKEVNALQLVLLSELLALDSVLDLVIHNSLVAPKRSYGSLVVNSLAFGHQRRNALPGRRFLGAIIFGLRISQIPIRIRCLAGYNTILAHEVRCRCDCVGCIPQ